MGPIKFNLSAGLMVCLLTTATLVVSVVPVGHATAIVTADDGDAAATANRKLTADGGHREEPPPKPTALVNAGKPMTTATQSCREACSQKHATKESLCSQHRDCSTCQRKCILENLSPSSRDSSHRLALVLLQMTRNESLVTADVAWVNAADSRPRTNRTQQQQCLVTWEVSGGGLMGNLLTESSTVQLSLWPETNYRVQVTCRNKQTETLVRSAPIVLNTSGATTMPHSHGKRPKSASEGDDDDDGEALSVGLEEMVQDPPMIVCEPDVSHGGSSYREPVLLGVYLTMLVFLIVLLTVISFIQPKSTGSSSSSVDFEKSDDPASIASSDKAVLVKNDVMARQAATTEILHV
ncbi:transmembrane protein fend-like [Ochlerotatus camptorhynchus]|uniref:transmembrane protein fend-like n=1 Tax=Ochlerotatus camptorhynchus TaxID=644619 RepID=UPI0031CE889A